MLYHKYPYGIFLKVSILKGLSDADIHERFSRCYHLNPPDGTDVMELRKEMACAQDFIDANSGVEDKKKPSKKLLSSIGIKYEHDYIQWLVCGTPESVDFIKTETMFYRLGLRRIIECELMRAKPIPDVTKYANLFVENTEMKLNNKYTRRYSYVYWNIYMDENNIYKDSIPRIDYDGLETYMLLDVTNLRYNIHRQYLYGDRELCDGLQGLPGSTEALATKIVSSLGNAIARKCSSEMTAKLTKPEVQLFTEMRNQLNAGKSEREKDKQAKEVIQGLLSSVDEAAEKRTSLEKMAKEKRKTIDTSKEKEE